MPATEHDIPMDLSDIEIEKDPDVVLNYDLARPVEENLKEYRKCMDTIDDLNRVKALLHKRRCQLDRWAGEYRSREGVDSLRSNGIISLTMKDDVRWNVEDWEEFVLGLIGIDVGNLPPMAKLHEAILIGQPDKIEEAIRSLLTFGDLHVIHKRKTDSKIAAMIAGGVQFQGRLTGEGYTRVTPRRSGIKEE